MNKTECKECQEKIEQGGKLCPWRHISNDYCDKVICDENTIILYTDGACRGNGTENNIGAWAYYLKFNDREKKESGTALNTTNNIMELTAAIRGLQAIQNKTAYPIEVYSDSMYLVAGASTWCEGWERKGWRKVKNVELWQELISLKKQCAQITFKHVDGHSGIVLNELVDGMCNAAMDGRATK